ncbi:methenyltetrahydrofolate cyclohydrolase [Peptococcaceae bacterium SCADC1_2_3]|nr:methenyltetrahydrofolate cyclohydrolase [Peptococcaceae bacterium SCADC1_2_3]
MTKIIDGKAIAVQVRAELKIEAMKWREQGIILNLAVIQVGDDAASLVYVRSKQNLCQQVGINLDLFIFKGTVKTEEILTLLSELNNDHKVHGIVIELPLPPQVDKQRVIASISPVKDVDGLHPLNKGYLLSGKEGLFPATPAACIEILKRSNIEIAGRHAVLVGRGETVGRPLIFMLLKENATVTVCHTRTVDLSFYTRQAEILFVAVGRPKLIKGEMVKPGAVVVDAGINALEKGICGDVDFEAVEETAGAITSVPGGVGSLTTVLLLKNVCRAIQMQQEEREREGTF